MVEFSMQPILPSPVPLVTIVDIGAMEEGRPRYHGLIEKKMARVIGFEPASIEYKKLKSKEDECHQFLPYFVGNGRPGTFHICRYPGCSSLYLSDPKVIDLFTGIGASEDGNFQVLSTVDVATVRLDDIEEVTSCDLLKIDVQGAELDVLEGADETLRKTAVVEAEVEFVPLYEKQPLFGDIDACMRRNGFLLHKLLDISGRAFRPFLLDNNPCRPVSQMLWADAVYIKDFTHLDTLSSDILLKTAIVLHEVYSSVDMAALMLKTYDAQLGTTLFADYMMRVAQAGKIENSFINVKDWI